MSAQKHAEGSSGLSLIHSAVAMAVEAACRQVLKLDPDTSHAFESLSGKILALEFSDLGFNLYFLPGEPLQVYSYHEGPVDTVLRGSSVSLVAMGLRQRGSDSLFSGDVQIHGDTQLGENFQRLIKSMDIDWEEHLARISGDLIAHKVGNLVRDMIQWGQDTVNTLQRDAVEYVQEEVRLVPAPGEVDDYISDIDTLRGDVDRFAVKVQRLAKIYQKEHKGPSGAEE